MTPVLPFEATSLGDLLQKLSLVEDDRIIRALAVQRAEGGRLGEIMVRLGMVDQASVDFALEMQTALRGEDPGDAMRRLVKAQMELRHRTNERMGVKLPEVDSGT